MRFDKIFERLPGRYLVLNTHFEIVAVNDAYLKATMTTRESILGRYIFDVFPEKPDNPAGGVDRLRESLQRVLGEQQTDIMGVTKYDIPHPEAGFEERYWSPVNTPVLDDQGEVSLIIHRVEDVTDYIRLQKRGHVMEQELFLRSQELADLNQQLREKNATLENRDRERERLLERLREADRIKSTFFANVSHEFRTPLTLLLGTLQQWHEGEPFTAERRALLIRNAVRLLKLVNNMLDFARVEAGRLHITFIPTDLAQITRRVAAAFETLIGQSGLAYEVACKELSEPVYIDVDSYEKILLNLLSNAFKYTISGKITVRLEQLSGDRVRLIVEDTGIGIPSEELPRIFDRFYRARASAGRTIEGSGIGLALTYELVRMHGGTIEARSELGRGSVFIVELPLGASHLPAEHVTETPPQAPSGTSWELYVGEAAAWLGEETPRPLLKEQEVQSRAEIALILVADDNLDMRHYLTSLLAPLGKILPAADGQAALKLARREQPDIIITDLMMPKMSGFELIRALREDKRTAQTPILLVSSHAGEEARLQCLRAGADDYLAKPFSTREFLGRVETLLKRAHEQQKLAQESRQKDAFLAMLAHELRNPMAPLRTGVDMLMHEPALPTRAQRTLLIMHRQITALSQIVDDLLDVSRLSRGKVKLRKELMDLREVANSAVDVVRDFIKAHKHELFIALPSTPAWAEIDRVRLEQVLINLLTNAAKYTALGGKIWLSLDCAEEQILVKVQDTGIGIEPQEMESMFELFEQGRRDASRMPGGLGIGLTVVKQLVEMHQGTVEARSAGRDKGSEFVVRLPRAQPPEDSGNRSSKEKLLEISTPKGAKMRVLVVDDSTDAADLLAKGITLLGGQALAIYTASEALRQVREWRPDVVILDIGLPEMDGYQLAQEISKRCEPLPRLIALTGYGQPEDRARSRSAGFDLHLVKPITLETLSEVLGLRSDSSE